MTTPPPTNPIEQAIEALESTDEVLKWSSHYSAVLITEALKSLKTYLPEYLQLKQLAKDLTWKPIDEYKNNGINVDIKCPSGVILQGFRNDYYSCGQHKGIWYEGSGDFKRPLYPPDYPTHYRDIIDITNYPLVMAMLEREEGRSCDT